MTTVSLYRASIPVFVRGLRALSTELDLAAASAEARGFSSDVLGEARLYPDMLSLVGQVQRASDTSKLAGARLSGVEAPPFEDKERTFAELALRIQNTIAFLETIEPARFDEAEGKPIVTPLGSSTPETFLFEFALPNFFFHLATVHAILRHNGVPLGKLDYLGMKKP